MKILFDHQIFSLQKVGGISRYFAEILHRLTKVYNVDAILKVFFSENKYLQEHGFDIHNFGLGNFEFKGKERIYYQLNHLIYSGRIRNLDKDVILHPTYFDDYFLNPSFKNPLVITFHDLIHEHYFRTTQNAYTQKMLVSRKKLVNRADLIITVSDKTKFDLIEFYNVNENKIHTVYHGQSLEHLSKGKSNSEIKEEYLLFIGDRLFYKNFEFMVDAFNLVSEKYPNIKLYFAGGRDVTSDELEFVKKNGLSDKVKFLNYLSENEMASMYSSAIALVFPSLMEGFGLPILEAFANDCVCLLSDIEVFHEIAGDCAIYFNPRLPSTFLPVFELIYQNESIRDSLTIKMKSRLNHFSWDIAAEQTYNLYKNLL